MKTIHYLLVFILLSSLFGCAKQNGQSKIISKKYSTPKVVTISGEVKNADPENKMVELAINRIGMSAEDDLICAKLDEAGKFQTSFTTYLPTDLWLTYQANFLVLARPGDHIHIVFDGSYEERPELLKDISFSGDYATENQQAATFQERYFSNPTLRDWDAKKRAYTEHDTEEYLSYLAEMNDKRDLLFNSFMKEVSPKKEVKIWADTFLDKDYYSDLFQYPQRHRQANSLSKKDWNVPDDYFERSFTRFPITKELLHSGNAIAFFSNQFQFKYVLDKTAKEWTSKNDSGFRFSTDQEMDSVFLSGIIKHTPDALLKEIILSDYIREGFSSLNVDAFEKNRDLILTHVKEPFLREPLLVEYKEIKKRIENPKFSSEQILEKLTNSSTEDIVDAVFHKNKGKVIYVDVWATWCGPCISEFPNSKLLQQSMEDKDVSFVYLCVDSEEKLWKSLVAKHELGGDHFFLNEEQSATFRENLKIDGVPFYFLIDQEGVIVGQGNLPPEIAEEKILELLEK